MKYLDFIATVLVATLVLVYYNHLKLKKIMGQSQERFDLLMGRLDTITTDIATDYAQLLKAIEDGADSISEESFAKHEANIAKLETLGASVENPVPEEPPTEPPVEPV